MRPFLIVGCGGSGGQTLQFLMDQLSADLSRRGIGQLPAAWQFLHVDVPSAPDGVGAGLPPAITEQARNGRYVGMATFGTTYPGVSAAVATALGHADRLDALATWRTDPREVNVPIVAGAGQMRSVGRVVTLSGLTRVRDGLRTSFDALHGTGATEELRAVAKRVSPGTESQAGAAPVVLVVSSMAGGAGASMVLDVCRLLSHLPGVDPALVALFLYTPEVFEEIPKEKRAGVPGNALAMTGELIASQLGAATRDDLDIFAALGLGATGSSRPPFGRVFPIGLRIGAQGAKFGGGRLRDVYRGVGRGLAALMLSGEASSSWVGFDLTNHTPRPAEQEHFGWGAEPTQVQWGSFGFAQLSLGRDRYAEYAAQRLARHGVTRLVAGHRSPVPGTDEEQLNRVVEEQLPQVVEDLGLVGATGAQTWFRTTVGGFPREAAGQVVAQFVEPTLALRASTDSGQWTSYVLAQLSAVAAAEDAAAAAQAYGWVHAWHRDLLDRVQRTTARLISGYGLPTAVRLLERLGRDTDTWAQQLKEGAALSARSCGDLDPGRVQTVRAVKGTIDGRHAVVPLVREACVEAAEVAVAGQVLGLLADLVAGLRTSLLEPLRAACVDAVAELQQAVQAEVQGSGLAQLRTDEPVEWPERGQPVPARFTHAQNEVLLIDASTFEGQFDDHVVETTSSTAALSTPQDGERRAVTEVLLNRWSTSGTPPVGDLVERLSDWRPAVLPRDPGTGDRVPSHPATFRVACRPAEVLGRARAWVARPGMPFDAFVSVSLRDYVADEHVAESVRAARAADVRQRFSAVLELAAPLVAVSAPMVAAEHNGGAAQVSYKFSDVPFGGLALGHELVQRLEQRSSVDHSGVEALKKALRPLSDATRIDVFGSYAPLSPLTFSSLLAPLHDGWASAVLPGMQASFWHHRRSRRLPGALAMNDRQRRAVVGGWYVLRLTGRLRLPGEAPSLRTAEVWDDQTRQWLRFADPLIAPQLVLDGGVNNVLPAVLLSYGLAMARATATGSVAPLLPYTVLRKAWDSSPTGLGKHDPLHLLTAARRLRDWLSTGAVPEGSPADPQHSRLSAEERRAVLLKRLADGRDGLGRTHLRAGEQGAPGGGRWSRVEREEDLAAVPLFHEVAPDVYAVYGTLTELVEGLALTGSADAYGLPGPEQEF